MVCEWWPACDDEATHRIDILHRETGEETFVYYCTGHLKRGIDEFERSENLEFEGILSLTQPEKHVEYSGSIASDNLHEER